MDETFKCVADHLYRRQYQTAGGEWTALYYARFTCKLKNKRRMIALGSELAAARDKLKKIEAQNVDSYDFDLDRQRVTETQERDGKSSPFTFSEWADKYPTFDDVKRKRSLSTDLTLIRLHLKPFFGTMLLTEISREALRRYIDARTSATVIRWSHASKKAVDRGTVSNELSLLRRMLRIAAREDYKVAVPSFLDLIVRTDRSGRELSDDDQVKVDAVYSLWMRRLAGFARETCLSEGDLLRLTEDTIDEKTGVIVPHGGRKKTNTKQIAPLTQRARAILDEIRSERRSGAAVPNVTGLIFTNADGKPISKGQIEYQVERAIKLTGVRKFVFHNYRNTALTHWARLGINVDIAMLASGHSSVQMHKRYVDLQQHDIAKAFGTTASKLATQVVTRKRTSSVNS